MAGTVLMIGTRKGLWIARSEDREAWTLSGPDDVMGEVHSVAIDKRRPRAPRGCSWAAGTGTSARRCMHSDDLGATWQAAADGGVAFPEDTGARPSRRSGRSRRRPPSRASCGPAPSRRRCSARPTAARPSSWSAGCGTTRTARSGSPAAAARRSTRCSRTRPTRSGCTSRCRPEASTAPPTAAPPGSRPTGHQGRVHARRGRATPSSGSACTRSPGRATEHDVLYAQNHGGVYRSDDAGDSWTSIADGLPAEFGFPVVTHPRVDGTLWLFPLESSYRRFPPDARLPGLALHRPRRDLDRAGQGPAGRRLLRRRDARRDVRRRRRPGRASTSAAATAASTPVPTRASRGCRWPSTCPTCSACAPPWSGDPGRPAARRRRDRDAAGLPALPPCDPADEGRGARRRPAPGDAAAVHDDPRRDGQAPGARRALVDPLHLRGQRVRRALGFGRLGRRLGLGLAQRGRGGARGALGPARARGGGHRRPRSSAPTTSDSYPGAPAARAGRSPCASSSPTSSRSTPATTATPTSSGSRSTGRSGSDRADARAQRPRGPVGALRDHPDDRVLPRRVLQHRPGGPRQPHDLRGRDPRVPRPPARDRQRPVDAATGVPLPRAAARGTGGASRR